MTARKIFPLITLAAYTAAHPAGKTPYDGLSGEELSRAVASQAAPQHLITHYTGDGGVWETFTTTDPGLPEGSILDCFSWESFMLPSDKTVASPDLDIIQIMPGEWWGEETSGSDRFRFDLVNLKPGNMDVAANKRNYPPGTVTKADYSNNVWAAGTGIAEGVEINCYQPPKGYEGDFARICFYMISLHRVSSWHHSAINFLGSGDLPCLRPWSARQLIAWHESDPPDSRETARDAAIERIQGNHNPFVRHPELAYYLFGDKLGQPFNSSGDDSDPDRKPLSARYRISSDKWIWLYSPHVPEDAVWTIDGQHADKEQIPLEELGPGTHILKYASPDGRGTLKIIIEQ